MTENRRFSFPVIGALAVLLVLGTVAIGIDRLESVDPDLAGGAAPSPLPSPTVSKTPASTGAGAKVKLGVFRGTSASEVRSFERWLGRDADYAVDFSSRDTWAEISNPAYMIDQWRSTRYRMVYSVALLPAEQSATIKAGATGAYDGYYRTLARNLVAGGQPDAILRLGWEFNLGSSHWSTADAKAWIAYWRHIVTAMRSVPGQKLKFDWNVNVGETTYEGHSYYPGNAYVDYVGVDVYDVSWAPATYPYGPDCSAACRLERQKVVWERLSGGRFGLLYWADFARAKGKPMSIPEWGLWDRPDGHGGADDPYFIGQMHAFMDDPRNRVAYQAYLESDGADGKHQLTTLKTAGAEFRRLFGQGFG